MSPMSDRLAQARAEAERTVGGPADPPRDRHSGFMEGLHWGVEWADANPKPHTITRAELGDAAVETLARVRGLHRPVESQWGDQACAECSNGWDLEVTWPCDTATEVEV